MLNACLLESVKIAQKDAPFGNSASLLGEIVEMLLHDERQEGAEYVAADGGVGGVEYWARTHEGLATPEEVLHLQEIAVAQDRLQRRDFGVGSQDENAVELRLVSQLAGVDLEDLFALGLLVFTQIPPVAGVANQSLIATLQPILQGDDNGFAVLLVFFRLGFVAADDVTLAIGFDFLEAHHRGEGHGHLTIHCEGRVAKLPLAGSHHHLEADMVREACEKLGLNASEFPKGRP